jgi:ATP-binding cassette subfamily B protein
VAIELSDNSRSFADYLRMWRRAFGLIWQAVPGFTILWVGLVAIQGILPGLAVYLSKQTIDSFVGAVNAADGNSAFGQPIVLFVVTGLCFVIIDVFQFLGEWNRTAQAEYFSDYVKDLIHKKSSDVDLEFYESHEYHDLMEQARGESQTKPLALLESLGSVVQNSITLVSFIAMLLVYGWAIPLLLIAGTLPGLLITFRLDRRYHAWWKKTATSRRWLTYFDAMLSHSSSAAEMRLFDLSDRFRERYQAQRGVLRAERFAHLKRKYAGKLVANTLGVAAATIALGWIAMRILFRTASLGDLAVFLQIFTRGQGMLRSLLGGVGQAMNNTLYLESLFVYLDLKPRILAPEQIIEFPDRIGQGIRLRDVSFSYPNEKREAISNFDLFVPAGKVVAIVGVNGAGKSTLIKLLCRFYDPGTGSIQIDGTDLRSFDVKQLRKHISVLFQFPMQFHETAARSIALGDSRKDFDLESVQTAAEKAGVADFISSLPNGYETLLGKWFVDGIELSGGEWQKIALARAYFRKAPLIILDEPTSFMDPWSEADWFDRFRSIVVGKTGILITHRFTIAMRADIIHVIDKGRIIESGTHRELLEMNGYYAESWRSQMQAANESEGGLSIQAATDKNLQPSFG